MRPLATSIVAALVCFAAVTAGGFAAFYACHPQLCVVSQKLLDSTSSSGGELGSAGLSGNDVTTGAPAATPSDNALIGHFNDQVTNGAPVSPSTFVSFMICLFSKFHKNPLSAF